jgi:hypothetical protein
MGLASYQVTTEEQDGRRAARNPTASAEQGIKKGNRYF